MMRNWNRLGWPAILAAALAASPAPAQFDGDPDRTDAILNQLKSVSKALGELDKKLSDALDNLEKSTHLRVQRLQADLNQLKQDLEALRGRLPARQPTTALYPPNGLTTGRLRLSNTSIQPVTIIVNNRMAYPLNPGEVRITDPVPAGTFAYEVVGIQGPTSRALAPGETFSIHVHPR